MRSIKIGDYLTDDQGEHVVRLWRTHGRTVGAFVDAVEREVIVPNLETIEQRCGQPMDPRYLSYAILYAILYTASPLNLADRGD